MPEQELPRLMNISEASEYLNVSKDTLRRWEREGKITPFRTPGNQRRYSKALLNEILAQSQSPAEDIVVEDTSLQSDELKEEELGPEEPDEVTAAEPISELVTLEQSLESSLHQAQQLNEQLLGEALETVVTEEEEIQPEEQTAPAVETSKTKLQRFYRPASTPKPVNSKLVLSIAAAVISLILLGAGMVIIKNYLPSGHKGESELISPVPR